ncbi:MAG: hypothetical protein HZC43_05510 [Nitrosomonadales bacterium]|nr:hypothetical protein [Nitrosomonadales bacterium]
MLTDTLSCRRRLLGASISFFLAISAALAAPPSIDHKQGGSVSIRPHDFPPGAQFALAPGGPYLQFATATESTAQAVAIEGSHAYVAAGGSLLIFGLAADSAPTLLAQAPGRGNITHVALHGGYAYLADRAGVLRVVDVRDPQQPQQIVAHPLPQPLDALCVEKGLAYLASGKRLVVLDASRPQTPQQIAEFALPGAAAALRVAEGYAYLAVPEAGLIALDVRDPHNIREAGRFRGETRDVALAQGRAYLASGATGLTILDITEPQAPRWLGSVNRIGNSLALGHDDGYVALRNDRAEITLVDVRNPKLPSIVASYRSECPLAAIALKQKQVLAGAGASLETINFSAPAPGVVDIGANFGGSRRAVIRDNILYVADWFSGLHLYDISEPTAPRHLSAYHTPGSSKGVAVRGDYAYVGDDDHGVQIIDVSNPKRPRRVSEIATPGLAYTMKLSGDYLYLADHRGGFHIIGVADAAHPVIVGSAQTAGKAWAVEVAGNIAYVAADDAGLLVFDVSDPQRPRQLAALALGGAAEDVVIRDHLAYVASFENGLHVLDLADPSQPRKIGHLATPGNARSIELAGNIAYIADWVSGIQVADISDPAQPRLIGSHDTAGWSWGVQVRDRYAYVLDWWGGIAVLDVADPAAPVLSGAYHLRGTTRDVTVRDGYAYVANGKNGLQIFDVKTPQNPIWMAGVDVAGDAQSVWLENRTVYLAAGAGGLLAVDVSNPFEPQKIRRFAVPADGEKVDLVRARGKLVFAADRQHGVAIIDAATGQQAAMYAAKIKDMWPAANGRLLLATPDGIEVVAVGDPARPRRMQRLPQRAELVRSQGNLLVLYDKATGITLYDYPKLKRLGRFNPAEEILDLQVSGNRLYAAGSLSGLLVLDISDARRPALKAAYPAASGAAKLSEFSGAVFLAGNETLTTVRLLPDVAFSPDRNGIITVNAPPQLPPGSYHLIALDAGSGRRAMQYDALRAVMPAPKSPPFSMRDFERAMRERGLTPMPPQ